MAFSPNFGKLNDMLSANGGGERLQQMMGRFNLSGQPSPHSYQHAWMAPQPGRQMPTWLNQIQQQSPQPPAQAVQAPQAPTPQLPFQPRTSFFGGFR